MKPSYKNEEAAGHSGERVGFSFGENWSKYLRGLDDAKMRQAEASLALSVGERNLVGKTFLDLGCGSGLFSLSALRLGAARVVSVDVDPNSIRCAERLREGVPRPEEWTIIRGSILETGFMSSLEPVDVVYSWGVLHHTGAMWQALENALGLVAPGGILCAALYTAPRFVRVHMTLKRMYNRLPRVARPLLEAAFAIAWLSVASVRQRRSPLSFVRDYGANARGMSFWRDVEDWLGGLPCEFATVDEIRTLADRHGARLERVLERERGANNEYVFRRP